MFWTRLLRTKSEVDGVAEPQLQRKRTAPAQTKAGDRSRHTLLHLYIHMHYSAIDETIECIRTRFNQKDLKVYQSILELLPKAIASEDHEGGTNESDGLILGN